MAPRKSLTKSKIVAKIVTGQKKPCGFCQREVDDELTYGKLYAIGEIQCHYFCVLLSSCLVQSGKDEDGLFGFLYEDILHEIERAKKHRCSYCGRGGANLGCSVAQCRKQFHLPCGRERNAVSLFYGNYKSFCQLHAPKQNIPAVIMSKAKRRMLCDKKMKRKDPNFKDLKELSIECSEEDASQTETQSVCVICYEAVDGYPTINTFWPPCCARDAWFHRTCLQRMALSAGMHYLKCPLCNDKDNFYQAVVTQGYYVPDRDAAWELEQNAFAEIYEREVECSAEECRCPMGRSHDADNGAWSVRVCALCGSSGEHAACAARPPGALHVCAVCRPAAHHQLQHLATCLQAVIEQEEQQRQRASRVRRGPVMPARMSLRRTKRHTNTNNLASCSSSGQDSTIKCEPETQAPQSNTLSSRQDLNLKTPKRETQPSTSILEKLLTTDLKTTTSKVADDFKPQSPAKNLDLKYNSPTKLLEESLRSKMGSSNVVLDEKLIEELRIKFKKPKPLSEKRKIVNDILNGVFDDLLKDPKCKEPVKQWHSPKKCDVTQEVIEILDDSPPSKSAQELTIKEENVSDNNSTPKRSPSVDLKLQYKNQADDTYPIFNTPKKLKTVDILKDSSLEISAKDEIINIDMIKLENSSNDDFLKKLELRSPEKSKKCSFKFSPFNKEVLETANINIDVESFKDRYLNEVGLQRVKHNDSTPGKLPRKPTKRSKKRKTDDAEIVLKYNKKKRKEQRKNISIKDKNIKVKIKWRKEQLKLKITDSKKKKRSKKFKQYILDYSPSKHSSLISKPENDVTPIKRKYVKLEKSPDNLVQTSIQKFFKIKSPKKD